MKKKDNRHVTNIRMESSLWVFLRRHAFDKNVSINSIVVECLEKYRKKNEKNVDAD